MFVFFSEPYPPENTLSADHLITLPVFPTQSRFDTSLLSGGVEDSPKMFFVLFTRKLYSRWKKFLRNFTAWSVRLETNLYRNDQGLLSFACPIFAYSGETLQESSKIFVDTVPMPGLIAMTLVQWAQLWLSVYQQTDARTRDKTVETFTFQDAYRVPGFLNSKWCTCVSQRHFGGKTW